MKDYAEEIERNEIDYMDSADAIVAASEVLTKKIRSLTNKPIHFIPNGVDLKNFRGTSEAHQRVKRVVSRSIIGILGNHDRAAELHKVIDAVHLLSKSRLVFIIAGRGKAIPEIRSRIRREKLKNIKFLPQVPLSSAPRVVSSFDVGLCPYLKSGGADASSPMRLLMYSAAGLPTVCTELTEIRNMDFPNVIMVRDDHRALADGILHGLTLPRLSPKKIQKYDIYKLAIRYEKVLEGKERSETREEV
ncbi:MAG: glycosyltransferase [Anaerolineales bacterium]|nr:glycosyltransferase [Anaerolineales bacterium]